MRGRVLMTAAAIMVVAAGVACSSNSYGPPAGGGGRTTSLTVRDNRFSPTPDTISLSGGPTATWTWSGANPHSVTFEDGVMSTAGLQSSGMHQRTFSASGQYRYRCTNHSTNFGSGMSGTIVVVP